MKKIRRLLAVVMAIWMCFPQSLVTATVSGADEYRYFYNQLNPEAKKIYDAMYDMYQDGTFKKGEDCDLIAKGYVTEDQAVALGGSRLLSDMGAARDAFQYDYPDVFYVDFSALSLRVNQDNAGVHAYLGAGRRDSYLLPGFRPDNIDKAISDYEAAIRDVVDLAKAAEPPAGRENEDPAKTMTEAVHKYIVENMIYKFEDEVTDPNCNARTAYDCLVYGEGVCEAYTRGFKAVLDRLGIPCVCVYGVYRVSETVNEEHIWNYVQIGEEWYGVDATHDDPRVKTANKKSGKETEQFLLVGLGELSAHHVPIGILSAANYEFTYPGLAMEALREKTYYNDGDFVVKVMEDSHTEGDDGMIDSGTILVSYKGKNYTENAAEGEYILTRFATCETDEEGNENWRYTNWSYVVPSLYAVEMEPTESSPGYDTSMGGHYLKFIMPHLEMIQFAVTTVEPDLSQDAILNGSLYCDYYGLDPSLFTAMTDSYQNIYYSGYVAPPYPKTVTPQMNVRLVIGGRNHVKAVYDQELALTGETFGTEVQVHAPGDRDNVSAADYYKIENLTFDGNRTIEFDFTPSQQFADNAVYYNIHFTGIAGKKTGRELINLTYMANFQCASCAYRAQGYDWNIFGQPQLLDTADVATGDWIGRDIEDGTEGSISFSSKISHRLTLVTTQTTPTQSREMEQALLDDEKIGLDEDQILSSNTYNIQLSICKQQVIQTGQGVRVSIGFPAGFNYDSSLNGVTFKAYHYITDDKTGKITGVEEIPLTVTPYGLIVLVKSFSPFTIAAVDLGEETPANTAKTVVLSGGEGGEISASDAQLGMLTLQEGDRKVIHIKAADGYVIDTVSVAGVYESVGRDSTSMDLAVDYADMANGAIVDARFVAESVAKREQEANASVVLPAAEPADIHFEQTECDVAEGEELVLAPDVSDGVYTYQWYHDGELLRGQTDRSLVIGGAQKSDAGKYTLKATAFAGTAMASSEASCTVFVSRSKPSPSVTAVPTASTAPNHTILPPVSSTEPPRETVFPSSVLKKGDRVTLGKINYTVTKTATKRKGAEVKVSGVKKPQKKVVIPSSVKLYGITYKVTEIGARAFQNDKKLQKVSLGKNVTKIGKKAFFNCENLRKITIKAEKIRKKNVGKKAFDGIASKVKVKTPENWKGNKFF